VQVELETRGGDERRALVEPPVEARTWLGEDALELGRT
jgi:hypothetical protein